MKQINFSAGRIAGLSFLLSIISLGSVFAQAITIKGKVLLPADDFYFVALLSADDSTLLTMEYFDSPDFRIENKAAGASIVQITSSMLYEPWSKKVGNYTTTGEIDLGCIELIPRTISLQEIEVKASLPPTRIEKGKMIYCIRDNPAYSALTSAGEIIKRLPMVVGDKEKLHVFGKKNTLILINGRLPKNDNLDLIRPDDIKEIEVITNPSAEYNAEGAAVINILTKRNLREGLNGQVTASAAKGECWRSANTLQLAYGTNKINIYSLAGYNPNKRLYTDKYERFFGKDVTMYNTLQQKRNNKHTHTVTAGIDYYLHPQHTVAAQYQRIYHNPQKSTANRNDIMAGNILAETYQTHTQANYKATRNIYDVNYTFLIDPAGKKLNVDMGYVDYLAGEDVQITESDQSNHTKNKTSQSRNDIDLYSVDMDYFHPFANQFSLKAGLTYTYNKNKSFYRLYQTEQTGSELNKNFSNGTAIRENSLAGYISGTKQWDRLSVSAGIRYEAVHYENTAAEGDKKTVKYNDLFPSLSLNYQVTEQLHAELSYTRRINRPKFQDLDPATIYVDTFTYYAGNTNLTPSYSDNIALNFNYKRFLNLSVGYSRVKDPIHMYVKLLEKDSKVSIATTDNLENENILDITLSSPFRYKNWTTQQMLGIKYRSSRFISQDIPEARNKTMYYFYSYQGLQLPHAIHLSLIYQYNSSGLDGIFFYKERHIFNLAASKTLLNKRLTLSLRYDDIFKGNKQFSWVESHEVRFNYSAEYDASYITFSINYKFGSPEKKPLIKSGNTKATKRIK